MSDAVARWLGLLVCALALAAQRGPNVLLITVDDLNCELGCYGGAGASTPSIDALAARGVRFERAYCQYPLCNPSRISMHTGLRPQRTGALSLQGSLREHQPDVLTLPELFKRNGWFTARVGKVQHRNDAADDPRSWEATVPVVGREEELELKLVNLTRRVRREYGLAYLESEQPDAELIDARIAAAAIELLEAEREGPIFLAVGFVRPHVPFVAPRRFFEAHPLDAIQAPEVPARDLEDVPGLAVTSERPDLGMTPEQVRAALRGYRAATSFVDSQVGLLIDALDRLGLRDDTIVVLTSDHGYLLGEHGQWMKWSLFEPSARVPLILVAPGVRPGVSPRTVELLDLFPTLADLCGLEAPADLDGVSLRPLLTDPRAAWSRPAFTQLERLDFAGWSVRTDRWRYSEWEAGSLGRELYDHRSDPGELRNLAELPEHAATVAELAALIAGARGD